MVETINCSHRENNHLESQEIGLMTRSISAVSIPNMTQKAYTSTMSHDSEQAFSQVVEEYADFAYNVAYRMLRNAEDAEDAVQEAFISAYRSFGRFKGESKISTWLYRIVVNACLMKIRKEKSRSKYLVETGYNEEIISDWGNDPEEAAVSGELREVVEMGLDVLSPGLRAAIVLRDVQGLSTDEGAEALGLSVSAFKSRLHRGRLLLRQHIDGYLVKSRA
jgi:RNA polymerase sigma-70 factor (ECF subfamily)